VTYFRDPGAVPVLPWLGGARVRILVDAAATGGRLTVVLIEADAGYAAATHTHAREDETFYVLEGAAEFRVGEVGRVVSAGGMALLPQGLSHAYRVVADGTRLLNVCTPGGLDGFFREVSAHPDALLRVAAEYGITYVP
jgi:quercetin dioxygenase-like cupin family protein